MDKYLKISVYSQVRVLGSVTLDMAGCSVDEIRGSHMIYTSYGKNLWTQGSQQHYSKTHNIGLCHFLLWLFVDSVITTEIHINQKDSKA